MIKTAVVVAVMVAALGAAGPSFATNKKLADYTPPAPLAPVCFSTDKAGKRIEVACAANPA